jgi:hypothetical protein
MAHPATYPKYWDEVAPGHGEHLAMFARRFVGWDPVLKPAPADLDDRVAKAIFWKSVPDIRVFHAKQDIEYTRAFSHGLYDQAATSYVVRNLGFYRNRANLGKENALVMALYAKITAGVITPQTRAAMADPLGDRPCDYLLESLLGACLFEAVGKREHALKFLPLLNLWHDGIRPVGYDGNGNVIVRVAD